MYNIRSLIVNKRLVKYNKVLNERIKYVSFQVVKYRTLHKTALITVMNMIGKFKEF
jgi:hypothetical protein